MFSIIQNNPLPCLIINIAVFIALDSLDSILAFAFLFFPYQLTFYELKCCALVLLEATLRIQNISNRFLQIFCRPANKENITGLSCPPVRLCTFILFNYRTYLDQIWITVPSNLRIPHFLNLKEIPFTYQVIITTHCIISLLKGPFFLQARSQKCMVHSNPILRAAIYFFLNGNVQKWSKSSPCSLAAEDLNRKFGKVNFVNSPKNLALRIQIFRFKQQTDSLRKSVINTFLVVWKRLDLCRTHG